MLAKSDNILFHYLPPQFHDSFCKISICEDQVALHLFLYTDMFYAG